MQVLIQNRVIGKVLAGRNEMSLPWPLKVVRHFPILQRIPGRLIGIGFRPEHVRTPDVLAEASERVHAAGTLLGLLDERFEREHVARGPYFFPDLAGATEEDELAAIERGEIRATRVDYVAKLR